MLKKGAKHVRFYSPVLLRGTLWVSTAALNVMLATLLEWKGHQDNITVIDTRILWVSVAVASVTAALTYLDKTVAHFGDEKKKRDETESVAKAQTASEGHLR
jgi:hypothetical protein